jgi:hypothetical protein
MSNLESGTRAYFHRLYRIMCLLDGVDCQPLCSVRQNELINDLNFVIRQPNGSQCISHVYRYRPSRKQKGKSGHHGSG